MASGLFSPPIIRSSRKSDRHQRTLSFASPGALRGKIKVAEDFDNLPADVLASMKDEA
jgi:hypothetical protein